MDRRSVLKMFGVGAAAAATGAAGAVLAPAAAAAVVNPFSALMDRFDVPLGEIPKGLQYNWKRVFIDRDTADLNHLVDMIAAGWRPVPSLRHPSIGSDQGYWIEVAGLVLMEKPEAPEEAPESR